MPTTPCAAAARAAVIAMEAPFVSYDYVKIVSNTNERIAHTSSFLPVWGSVVSFLLFCPSAGRLKQK